MSRMKLILHNLHGSIPAELSLLSCPQSAKEFSLRFGNVEETNEDKMDLLSSAINHFITPISHEAVEMPLIGISLLDKASIKGYVERL